MAPASCLTPVHPRRPLQTPKAAQRTVRDLPNRFSHPNTLVWSSSPSKKTARNDCCKKLTCICAPVASLFLTPNFAVAPLCQPETTYAWARDYPIQPSVTNMKSDERRKLGELLMTNFNASVSIMQKESDAKFKEEQKQRPPQSWPDVISISTGSAVPQEVCACVRVCNGCVERLCVCVCVCVQRLYPC